ncbi:unnamed protein product [Ectocarpus sp. 12 AP-2014]
MRPTDGQKPGAAVRVLVPLCGKTVDMPYLAQKGERQERRDLLQRFSVHILGVQYPPVRGAEAGVKPAYVTASTQKCKQDTRVWRDPSVSRRSPLLRRLQTVWRQLVFNCAFYRVHSK